jgi:type I restriction enzyme M protein
MPDRLTLPQLESYLWGAATILRGLVDAGDYKQFIFPLVFYKRLSDVWDEDYAQALTSYADDAQLARAEADERFRIPAGAHWNQVRTVAKDVGKALQDAMRAIEAANPGRFDGIFGDAPWTNKERLPDSTLKDLLEHFASLTLSTAKIPEDTLGDAYEYLIGKFADDGGHTAQEFYTNRTVVHLMTQLLKPQPGERIYDPTCGTGGMLLSALAQVKRAGGEQRTLRHPLPARRAVSQGRGRNAAQADRGRPGRLRAGTRPQPVLQLPDGGLRRPLPHLQTAAAPGPHPVHRCAAGDHPRARLQLPQT